MVPGCRGFNFTPRQSRSNPKFMDFGPESWIFGIWDFCPGILVPGFGVPEVQGPDFKSFLTGHAASGGSILSKMTPPEFQRSFQVHFWQLFKLLAQAR